MAQEQDLLLRAAMEIKQLRRQNEIMGAKLEVFNSMMWRNDGDGPGFSLGDRKSIRE